MGVESAICLATQQAELPAGGAAGGFSTPAAAMGEVLIERLHNAGIAFEITDGAGAAAKL